MARKNNRDGDEEVRPERGRAFRRHQNKRIIKKRLGILRNVWDHNIETREEQTPGLLRKWNFTCDCKSCKMDRYSGGKEKIERQLAKRGFSEEHYT